MVCVYTMFYLLFFLLQPEPVTAPEGDGEGGQREQRDAQTAREGGANVQSVRLDRGLEKKGRYYWNDYGIP